MIQEHIEESFMYSIYTRNTALLCLSPFSTRFGILELRNRVMQNDVTLRVTNSKTFTEILLSSY